MKKINEEGGVLGIYRLDSRPVAKLTVNGLLAMQHRGQTSCGMVINDDAHLSEFKGDGLVRDRLNGDYSALNGNISVGQVRSGSLRGKAMAQPLISRYIKGSLTIAIGGAITNAAELRRKLESEGAIFQSGNDAEIMAHLLARERTVTPSIEAAVSGVMPRLKGAFAAIVMSPRKLLAFRDEAGIRPLTVGKIEGGYVFASEDSVLSSVGATKLRDVLPGELAFVNTEGLHSFFDGKLTAEEFDSTKTRESAVCAYEYMYFARPDSIIDGKSVYSARINAGKALYRSCPVEADVVIGLPAAGLHFALGYAAESKIPFGDALIRNYYINHEIDHESSERERVLSVKLGAVRSAVEGLRVALIDAALISGATAERVIRLLKENGAKEVHLRIACPPFKRGCPYSDFTGKGRVSDEKKILQRTKADSVGFLPLSALDEIGLPKKACRECFK